MKKLALSLTVLMAVLLPELHAAPAHATINHTWVSHNGNDGNPCSQASPCLTIGQALTQTFTGGTVSCLDAGGFGFAFGFTITFTVTINCSETMAANSEADGGVFCSNAITINAPGSIVTLRGLSLDGDYQSSCTSNGIAIQSAAAVFIEDCVIEGFPGKGILDARTTGLTRLAVKNTVLRSNSNAGIVVAAAPKNSVVLENVHAVNNGYGIAVATGNNVVISRSVMSENSVAGIEADSGASVLVENTKITHNVQYGIFAQGTVTLANSDISFNTSSINGSTLSYGNNRIFDNGAGTAPTLISQQ